MYPMASGARRTSQAASAASPVGSTADEAAGRRARQSPAYREHKEAFVGCREIAWLLIRFRMDRGLSQAELAEMVGTSNSQISRIESGRHRTNLDTLTRIAHALDVRLVLGFESTSPSGKTRQEVVAF